MSQIEKSRPQPQHMPHRSELPPESRRNPRPEPRKKGARRTAVRRDLSASIVVFLLAVPLSLGIALATGAPPQAGLVAAVVGGIVAGLLGGAPLQISGAATGLLVVTADLVQRYGWRATCAITVLAGIGATRPRCGPRGARGTGHQSGDRARHAGRHRRHDRDRAAARGARRQSRQLGARQRRRAARPAGASAPRRAADRRRHRRRTGGLAADAGPRLPAGPGWCPPRWPRSWPRRPPSAGHGRAPGRPAVLAEPELPACRTPPFPPSLAAVLTVTLVASMESLLSAVAVDNGSRPNSPALPWRGRISTASWPVRACRTPCPGCWAASDLRGRDARLGQCRRPARSAAGPPCCTVSGC